MKIAVFFLVVLGMVAAGAAAVLYGSLQSRFARAVGDSLIAEVLIVQENLPARTLLTGENVKIERIPKEGLPQGYFTNPAQAIGKTLKVAVVKGQPLSSLCCVPKGSVDDLLRPGMLAFPVQLSRRSASTDLLYPGCVVDVFATFPLRDRTKGEAVTTPLLQGIQVLGLADETVLTPQEKEGALEPRRRSSDGNVTVTLEVTARQAAALQLAIQQGSLSLPMRNPLDKQLNPMEPMVVKEGQLTAASESMDPQALALIDRLQRMLGQGMARADANHAPAALMQPVVTATDPNAEVTRMLDSSTVFGYIAPTMQKRSAWQMTIISGQDVKTVEMPLTGGPEQWPTDDANN